MYNGLVKSVRHIQVKRISFHPKLFEAIITYQPHPTESDQSDELEYKKHHDILSEKGFQYKLVVTLGGKGCRWNGKDFTVEEVPVKDVSGAGDTFLAGLVRGYLDTQNIEKAINFAQKCTTIVVQKHGVAAVELKELQSG